MLLGKGQSYRANSFDLGFINIMPVSVVLKITGLDRATNELELSLVSTGVDESEKAVAAIAKWFTEVYPSRAQENSMLRNVQAFERFVHLNFCTRT